MSYIKPLFKYIIQSRAESSPTAVTGKTWLQLADEFNMNQSDPPEKRGKIVKDRWASFKRSSIYRSLIEERDSGGKPDEQFEKEELGDSMSTTSRTHHLYSVEAHAKFFGIDMDIWEVDKKLSNYWGANAGDKQAMALHQLKVWWKKKEETLAVLKESLMSQMSVPKFKGKKIDRKGSLCLELMITDHHLGKVGFDPKTMEFNWTLPEAGRAYSDAIDHLVSQVDPNDIDHFLLPTGNDLLNIDNSDSTTTRGTPQMSGTFWESMFRYSKELVVAAAEKLSAIAPVKIIMVRGNHDKNSVFSLGEVLSAYFSENPNVEVVNELVKRCYHEFGNCMIGYTHGQGLTFKDAGRAPSIDEAAMFGRTKYRAMHLGHLHIRKMKKFSEVDMLEEIGGVDVEICPSLSPVDRWHHENLYLGNIRRTKMFVWHRGHGLISEHYWSI